MSASLRTESDEYESNGRKRVTVFITSLFVVAVAGNTYAFSSFSPQLKDALHFHQSGIELVGELLQIGQYFGPVQGILVDCVHPAINSVISLVFAVTGYGLTYFAINGIVTITSAAGIGALMALVGFANGLIYQQTLAVNIYNWPVKMKGRVIAVMASFFGFSALIFTGIYELGYHSSDVNSYLLMVTVASFVIYAMAMFSVRKQKFHRSGRLLDDEDLIPPIFSEKTREVEPEETDKTFRETVHWVWTTLLRIISDPMFWAVFLVFMFTTGGGLLMINNVGSIIETLNDGRKGNTETTWCITLISIGNGVGRLAMGISDYTSLRRGVFLAMGPLIMSTVLFCAGFFATTVSSLYYICGGVGVAYGCVWSTIPQVFSDQYGDEFFGQVFGYAMLGPALGSIVFNSIAGAVYEAQIDSSETDCLGFQCYKTTYFYASAGAALAFLLSCAIIPRTKYCGARREQEESRPRDAFA